MNHRRRFQTKAFIVVLSGALLSACGGGGGSSSSNNSGGGGTSTPPVNNTASVVVDLGPAGNSADQAFTNVTICVPGTTSCQTIDHIQVDTGSSGLRVLGSFLTISLPQQTSGSNSIGECVQFADMSFVWGPVQSADIQIAGEIAKSVPIQVINGQFNTIPTSCSNTGTANNDVTSLGAKGILGVGPFRQDCGSGCANSAISGFYYSCNTSGCQSTIESLTAQVQNPVWMFPTDNNGVLIQFPAVADAGQGTATGSLIFGIGTQSNNGLGAATVLTLNNRGDMTTRFNTTNFTGFIDSGSNVYFFLDQTATGMPPCSTPQGFYCPASQQAFSATNIGVSGANKAASFNIQNANTLFQSPTNAAFNNLGGPNPNSFDFGLPFFFGKSVFTAIEGQSTPGGTGPYFAY